MGAGGSLCSSTAQSSAFLNVANGDMPDASALWNLNRQLSFLMGSALLAALLSAFLLYWPTPQAWRIYRRRRVDPGAAAGLPYLR